MCCSTIYLLLNTQENEKRITQRPFRACIVGLLEVGLFWTPCTSINDKSYNKSVGSYRQEFFRRNSIEKKTTYKLNYFRALVPFGSLWLYLYNFFGLSICLLVCNVGLIAFICGRMISHDVDHLIPPSWFNDFCSFVGNINVFMHFQTLWTQLLLDRWSDSLPINVVAYCIKEKTS